MTIRALTFLYCAYYLLTLAKKHYSISSVKYHWSSQDIIDVSYLVFNVRFRRNRIKVRENYSHSGNTMTKYQINVSLFSFVE